MVKYKLIYFNSRGRAEPARMLFAAAAVEYEDVRLTNEQWLKLKPDMPGKQLPVLEIDGNKFGQSKAIINYLAEEFGYYGKDSMEHFKINIVQEIIHEILQGAQKVLQGADEKEKEKLKEEFKENIVQPKLEQLNDMAKNGHFVGDKITIADIEFYHLADMLFVLLEGKSLSMADLLLRQLVAKAKEKLEDKPKEYFPNLVQVVHSVGKNEQIAKYLEARPITQW